MSPQKLGLSINSALGRLHHRLCVRAKDWRQEIPILGTGSLAQDEVAQLHIGYDVNAKSGFWEDSN